MVWFLCVPSISRHRAEHGECLWNRTEGMLACWPGQCREQRMESLQVRSICAWSCAELERQGLGRVPQLPGAQPCLPFPDYAPSCALL